MPVPTERKMHKERKNKRRKNLIKRYMKYCNDNLDMENLKEGILKIFKNLMAKLM